MTAKAIRFVNYTRSVIDTRDTTDAQHATCLADGARRGWVYAGEYRDRCASGATMERTGLQRLIADAQARGFDAVVTVSPDRVSRNPFDMADIVRRFAALGIGVYCVGGGDDAFPVSATDGGER